MNSTSNTGAGELHLTSGETPARALREQGVARDVLVWRDVLYDGPRRAGWPEAQTLALRAQWLADGTGGGLAVGQVRETLQLQYERLQTAAEQQQHLVLWFDACLFDQAMLAHVLSCWQVCGGNDARLICVDAWPGIEPFDGLGQLSPEQLAGLVGQQQPVTAVQTAYAVTVDRAFARQDRGLLEQLAAEPAPPLPWVPAAVARWLAEQPDPATGLTRLEALALAVVNEGVTTPGEIFTAVAARDTHPQYWGDTTLWARLNALAEQAPPLVEIHGPTPRLPLWHTQGDVQQYRVAPVRR